ncbi:sugar ABC transporter ATP-binding protein [Vibrio zhanjiangensis]|uniref:Sugar ABC transporter ATP-binding protein n=1 Tax=Vibrio zhanjiangensis TaxID=1046128 RepID=A0ABQ6F650_9VIBR|nr:ABC transporter ATP-binding protein [Vibrio zhanjiangensis]GLT20340.1 sugar ABC transporter ATP-binding protein [Vibrio zhanjiangensis]
MCSKPVLEVIEVSKEYDLFVNQKQKFLKLVSEYRRSLMTRKIEKHVALEKITIQANPGEVIGVLGRNGAGKSTLLQIICGTVSPTHGTVRVRGRLCALLELGAGFNPDFTGRENVYINGAILGLSRKEIESKFQSILDFADIGESIEQPVKNYSSGMFMRLAFAVATSVEPNILIVDEALAVGDAKFQAKCFRKIAELKERGTTILLVSHSTEQITRHCSKALILDKGKMLVFGEAKEVANQYLELLFGKKILHSQSTLKLSAEDNNLIPLELSRYYNEHEHRWGNGDAEIFNFNIINGENINPPTLQSNQDLTLSFTAKFYNNIENLIVGITLKTQDGITVFGRNTSSEPINERLKVIGPGEELRFSFKLDSNFCSGNYLISIGLVRDEEGEIIPLERRYDSVIFYIEGDTPSYGIIDLFDKVEVF